MVKRLKDIAASSSGDSKLGETIRDSAQQIWLAGLGAFAKAQEEGAKVFDALVQEGKTLEEKTRKSTREKMGGMAEQVNKAAAQASAKTNAAWDKIEQVFEDRVARSLKSLGVPTDSDVTSLTRQIEELSAEVRALRATKAAAKKSPARPARKAAPAKKAAKKRATA
jgi:poly(hydroxyalkanoate) granule-associated protein